MPDDPRRVLEEAAVPEAVPDAPLQLVELVAEPHDPRADILPVAVDNPPGLVGGIGGHGNPDVAERVDGHRPDRLRIPGHAKTVDASAVEQGNDDARFNV